MRFSLYRICITLVLSYSLSGCQQSPVALLRVSEADIVATPVLIKAISQHSTQQCSPAGGNATEPLYPLFCTYLALQKPVADSAKFESLLQAQQSALQQLVQHHLVDGQWRIKGKGYRPGQDHERFLTI